MPDRTCPICRTTKTRLAARKTFSDVLLSALTIYHFRCQLCAKRFMDTYGHLFPSKERGWTDKLDDESLAPKAHPQREVAEQPSDKLRENMVAVPRIELGTRGL